MKLIDYTDPNSFSSKMRRRRMRGLTNLVQTIANTGRLNDNAIKICDIGGTATYWGIFPFAKFPELKFQIDLFNMNYDGDLKSVSLPSNVDIQKHIGNGCNLSGIPDNSYDLSHSNSVIEHVGNWKSITAMAKETLRVSTYHFLQTPNFWFPIEPHFLLPFYAGLPRPLRIRQQELFNKREFPDEANAIDESVRLLTKRELTFLFPQSKIERERFFLFTKSFIVSGKSYIVG